MALVCYKLCVKSTHIIFSYKLNSNFFICYIVNVLPVYGYILQLIAA